jgi:hypothetical protein
VQVDRHAAECLDTSVELRDLEAPDGRCDLSRFHCLSGLAGWDGGLAAAAPPCMIGAIYLNAFANGSFVFSL